MTRRPHDLSSSCERSSRLYQAPWAAQRGTATFTFAACAGATTSTVRSSQLGGLSAVTDPVTITIGGNDADFVGTVAAAGGTFLDSRTAFTGHEVCSGARRG